MTETYELGMAAPGVVGLSVPAIGLLPVQEWLRLLSQKQGQLTRVVDLDDLVWKLTLDELGYALTPAVVNRLEQFERGTVGRAAEFLRSVNREGDDTIVFRAEAGLHVFERSPVYVRADFRQVHKVVLGNGAFDTTYAVRLASARGSSSSRRAFMVGRVGLHMTAGGRLTQGHREAHQVNPVLVLGVESKRDGTWTLFTSGHASGTQPQSKHGSLHSLAVKLMRDELSRRSIADEPPFDI